MGIGEYAQELIRAGHGNVEVAQLVRLRYPKAKTSHRSIAYYRCHMRKAGENIPKHVYQKVQH